MKERYEVVNMTGYDVKVYRNGICVRVYPRGGSLRLVEEMEEHDMIDENVPLHLKTMRCGALPPKIKGRIYIVSILVAMMCPDRDDFVVMGSYVRDFNGSIIGCAGLTRVKVSSS